MEKKQLVIEAIKETEIKLERLKKLLNTVNGSTLEVCPECKTKNRHWYISGKWCCAFC